MWHRSLVLSFLASCMPLAAAATFNIVGDCRFLADPSRLQAGAGSDLVPVIESQPGCYRIFIQTQGDQDRWRLSASCQVQALPDQCMLMMRVSNASIGGQISQSWLDWQQLGNQRLPLAEGQGPANAIEVQIKIVDLHLKNLNRAQYAPRITFEVEDL